MAFHTQERLIAKHQKHPLLDGLNALRLADKFTDVTMIVEGISFRAHRVVLAACSDYFSAMFSDQMLESRLTEIPLLGLTARAFDAIMQFVYTSKLQLNIDNVEEMLAASTHVQMFDIINACVQFLEAKINLDNCLAIATLADTYMQLPLKQKAYRYICSHLTSLASSTEFVNIGIEQLRFILEMNYPVDLKEVDLLKFTLKWCMLFKVDNDALQSLLKHIFFNEIPEAELKLFEQPSAICSEFYRKALIAEYGHQVGADFSTVQPAITQQNFGLPAGGICNTRGMELALLKIGGFESSGLTNKIGYYSPTLGEWNDLTIIPHLDQCNYGTAVLCNDLFVVGGSYDVYLKEYIHPFGFRYSPLRDMWDTIAPIQSDRCRFSLNAVGTRYLFAVGGIVEVDDFNIFDDTMEPMSNVERYDMQLNIWTYMPRLTENRSQHAGVVIGDNLYISGGLNSHRVLSSFWCFDTSSEVWYQLSSMPTARCDHVLVAIDNKIYACGGWYESANETRSLLKYIDVYNIDLNEWSQETEVPAPKFYAGIAALERSIYFIGGLQSTDTLDRASSETFKYDVDSKTWMTNEALNAPTDIWELTCTTIYLPKPLKAF